MIIVATENTGQLRLGSIFEMNNVSLANAECAGKVAFDPFSVGISRGDVWNASA